MKRFGVVSHVAVFIFFLLALSGASSPPPELAIYTYDSMVAQGGLGPELFSLFEKKCDCKIKALPSGDASQLLSRLQLDAERGKTGAQIVLGIDQSIWERAKPWVEPWGEWTPKGYDKIREFAKIENGFLPFDYGVFAFMADRQALKEANLAAPQKLSDLLKPEWKRNLLLEDPRTSTPGLAFVLYVDKVHPRPAEFWKNFRHQWLTLTPGWDAAYSLFLKKQAPLVWSYTTSQAYHREHGDKEGRYQAILLGEGQPLQIEGAALVKNSFKTLDDLKRARAFLEFLVSPEAQSKIPLKNWMFPVRKGLKLPESFKNLPTPKKLIRLPMKATEVNRAMAVWQKAIGEAR